MSTSDKYFLTNPYGYPRAGTGKMKKVPNAPATLRRTRAPPAQNQGNGGGGGALSDNSSTGVNADSASGSVRTDDDKTWPQDWDKGIQDYHATEASISGSSRGAQRERDIIADKL